MKLIGIYSISNNIDDRLYVGSSVNIEQRWKRHITDLHNNVHHSKHLQRFVNKYGIEVLSFNILEYSTVDNLLDREQYYLDTISCKFNNCKIAGSCLGSTRSDDYKKELSKRISGSGNPTYGIERTYEWRKKISDANKGQVAWNKGKTGVYSQETLDKMSKSAIGRVVDKATRDKIRKANSKKIYQYDKDGTFIKEWNSAKKCGVELNIGPPSIAACAKGKTKTAGGFIFRYEYFDKLIIDLKHKSCKPVLQLDKKTEKLIKKWDSIKEAAESIDKASCNIISSIQRNGTAYGFKWKYKEKENNETN